jgi:hypothetical protein
LPRKNPCFRQSKLVLLDLFGVTKAISIRRLVTSIQC